MNQYFYPDALGSTVHYANASGTLLESYSYDHYGKPRVYDPAGNERTGGTIYGMTRLFTGQQWHAATGLYDNRNRFLFPELGRFLQPDPIGFAGDPSNLYRYCGNNPANWSDPTGLETIPEVERLNVSGQQVPIPHARLDLGGVSNPGNAGPNGQGEPRENAFYGKDRYPDNHPEDMSVLNQVGAPNVGFALNIQIGGFQPLPSPGLPAAFGGGSGGLGGGTDFSAGDVLGLDDGLRELARYNNAHASDATSNVQFANAMAIGVGYPAALAVAGMAAAETGMVRVVGPDTAFLNYGQGRIIGLIAFNTMIVPFDYHPIPSSAGIPVYHLNFGPEGRHFPIWPPPGR